jgi:hypothetical protein
MLDAGGGDPEIVFRDRLARLSKVEANPRVDLSRRLGHRENDASRHETINESEILAATPRVQRPVPKLTNDRRRKDTLEILN